MYSPSFLLGAYWRWERWVCWIRLLRSSTSFPTISSTYLGLDFDQEPPTILLSMFSFIKSEEGSVGVFLVLASILLLFYSSSSNFIFFCYFSVWTWIFPDLIRRSSWAANSLTFLLISSISRLFLLLLLFIISALLSTYVIFPAASVTAFLILIFSSFLTSPSAFASSPSPSPTISTLRVPLLISPPWSSAGWPLECV